MANVVDGAIVGGEFEFRARYYVHFRTNILGKRMNYLISLALYRLIERRAG